MMQAQDDFNYFVDQFGDMKILRYRLPDFDSLTLRQKQFIFCLGEAALCGRDILWDQNFKYNILIRKTIEAILESYSGDRTGLHFKSFLVYAKRVFFTNGIHHHYSSDKLIPEFSSQYFSELVKASKESLLPVSRGQSSDQLIALLTPILFDGNLFPRKVELKADIDIVAKSAINLYENVMQEEVESFYKSKIDISDPHPVSPGLNSKVIKSNGSIFENVYKSGGLYGSVIDKIVSWLEKAIGFAESEMQGSSIRLLIEYYKSGDLKKWNEFNILWASDVHLEVDFINGFIETYSDPLGMKATWESVVEYIDFEATKRTKIITENAQWFEDNSPIQPEYRKEHVTGIAAKVINVAMLGGDCYPASPLGINLPNADWIRKEVGSKSVTLANITEAHDVSSRGNGFLEEFANDSTEVDRIKKYGSVSDALHTDLHECVGHASGKLAEGTDPNALKNYASALEEARADLFALYYMMDPKIIELGLLPEEEAARSSYDAYIRNGLITQLVRIKPGREIEEAHMRNRSAICHWVYDKGRQDNAVEFLIRNGKTYVRINDYQKVRQLFGKLLKEIQRIKSEGDYQAGKEMIENFGVKVDSALHAEILERYEKLNLAPYTGFVNPMLIPEHDNNGEITNVRVEYVDDYLGQMMYYGKNYSFLS